MTDRTPMDRLRRVHEELGNWGQQVTDVVNDLGRRVTELQDTVLSNARDMNRVIDSIEDRVITLERARNVDVICGEPYDGRSGRQACSLPLGHEDHSWERATPDPVQRCKAFYIHEGDDLRCIRARGHSGTHKSELAWSS